LRFLLDSHWELQFSNPEKVQNLRKRRPVIKRQATGLDVETYNVAAVAG